MRLLLTLLFVSLGICYAQERNLKFEHFTRKEGLSHSNVMCILQDSRGFMWFGTRDGLNKYDGYEFTVYKNDPTNNNSLSHNYVTDIIEDSEGNLWIATAGGGLDMFDWGKEKFIHHQYTGNLNGMPSNYVSNVFQDSDKNLWFGTAATGLT